MKHTLKKVENCYKKIQLTFIALIITMSTFAQVGIGTPTPEKSVLLDLTSTTQGLLPPRLTYAQRNSIILPIPAGLIVWCSDCGSNGEMQVFDGINWTNMGDTATAGPFSNQLIGSTINGEDSGDRSGQAVSLSADGTRMAIGAPYNNGNGSGDSAGQVRIYDWNGSSWVQTGEDIHGETLGDQSGYSVAISANGTRVAIGAPYNDGNGNPSSGHVRLYDWNGSAWVQVGDDIDGEAASDQSGNSVALSADGGRVAIGAPYYYNNGIGEYTGHVRIYDWNGLTWVQVGEDIYGEAASDANGWSVALSADGTRVAIGAKTNDDNGSDSGQVRLYDWNNSSWVQTGEDIHGEAEYDQSGYSVALSADGTRVAIGAKNNSAGAGHVRIYEWNDFTWVQVGEDINGEATGDNSGHSVSLSADGTQVAIGAPFNNGNGSDSGHVRLYDWDGSGWIQIGADIDGESFGDSSGHSVSISADGSRVAIGTYSVGKVRVFQ